MSEQQPTVTVAPQVPDYLKNVRPSKGPQQGDSYGHAYCSTCNKVIYSINQYGPMTPYQINRTFCICPEHGGKRTGIVMKTRKVYGLEDIARKDFLKP